MCIEHYVQVFGFKLFQKLQLHLVSFNLALYILICFQAVIYRLRYRTIDIFGVNPILAIIILLAAGLLLVKATLSVIKVQWFQQLSLDWYSMLCLVEISVETIVLLRIRILSIFLHYVSSRKGLTELLNWQECGFKEWRFFTTSHRPRL